MKSIIIIGLLFLLLEASPTENEFHDCQKISIKVLEHCLEMHPYFSSDTSCWEESKNRFTACYKKVMLKYDRDEIRRRDRRRAAIEAKISLHKMDKNSSYVPDSFDTSNTENNKELKSYP